MRKKYAYYGDVKLIRAYCHSCKSRAIVLDDKLQCCDKKVPKTGSGSERMSMASGRRKKPPKKIQKQLIEKQENKCFYCNMEIGSLYMRKGKVKMTIIHWDHLVPFAYLQGNPNNNWVLSCNVCNICKGSKVFETVEDAKDYLFYRINKKEYVFLEDDRTN